MAYLQDGITFNEKEIKEIEEIIISDFKNKNNLKKGINEKLSYSFSLKKNKKLKHSLSKSLIFIQPFFYQKVKKYIIDEEIKKKKKKYFLEKEKNYFLVKQKQEEIAVKEQEEIKVKTIRGALFLNFENEFDLQAEKRVKKMLMKKLKSIKREQ